MEFRQHLIIWAIGGALYVGLELLYRRRSHPSMFVVGGLCFWSVGMLGEAAPGLPLAAQAVLGGAVITALELLAGLLVNVALGWNVWDYSGRPCNFKGQICLGFFLRWVPLSLAAVFADDALRLLLFGQPAPVYRWF